MRARDKHLQALLVKHASRARGGFVGKGCKFGWVGWCRENGAGTQCRPVFGEGKASKAGGLSQRSVVAELLARVARSIAKGYKKNLSMSCESARLWLGQFRRRGKSGEKKKSFMPGVIEALSFWGFVFFGCRRNGRSLSNGR